MAHQPPADTQPERAGGPDGRAGWQPRACVAALALLAAAYLVQIASPLRLTPDAIAYLSMAGSAGAGSGLAFHGHATQYPPGYPLAIFSLREAGLGTSWAIVALNCLLLGIGLISLYNLLRKAFEFARAPALLVCAFTMLSFPFFKHVALPLSDILFFMLAMQALLAAEGLARLSGHRRWGMWYVALLETAAATVTRTAGIALVPAILWPHAVGIFHAIRKAPGPRRLAYAVVAIALVLAAAAAASVWVFRSLYFENMRRQYAAPCSTVPRVALYRLTEWGQLATNVPYSQAPAALRAAFPVIGAAALAIAVVALWARRRRVGPVEAFVVCYGLILLVWPYWDARFWLPVLPLVMAMVAQLVWRLIRTRPLRIAAAAYLALFALIGLIGLVYTTRISLSGSSFPDRYRYPGLEATYEAAWGRRSAEDPAVNADALRVLRRYEPRAASAPERRAE